ncbi:hypothetical protein FCV25MIE_24633 [Fagus crenata]
MLSFSFATSATPSTMLQTALLDSSSDPTVAPPSAPTPSLVIEPELIHTEPGLVLPPLAQNPSLDLEPPEPVPPLAPEPTYTDQSTSDSIHPLEMAPPESVSPLDTPPTTLCMETVLRKNREGGVLHEFSYSWLKGVTLKPIPRSLNKKKRRRGLQA